MDISQADLLDGDRPMKTPLSHNDQARKDLPGPARTHDKDLETGRKITHRGPELRNGLERGKPPRPCSEKLRSDNRLQRSPWSS